MTLHIGNRWELFVDDTLVDSLEDARFELQRPERREVAFQCDAPWEDDIAAFLSVFQDGSTVRLYYRASIPDRSNEDLIVFALAESTDGGLSFIRPDLGLMEWQGSKRNNILHIGEPPFTPPPAFLDANPACPPGQRYKGLSARWQKLYAMGSPDGLRWAPMQEEPLDMTGTFDTVNTAFWDAQAGVYRSFTRYFENLVPEATEADVLGPRPTVVRAIQSSTSPDFLHWSPPEHHQYQDAYTTMQLYTNSTLPCPGAEHILLSFPNRYVQERVIDPAHPYPGTNDALFMTSRDGVRWTRYAEAWVRPGLDELNWTERNNYPTWGIVPSSPNEWSMYISEHYRRPGTPGRLRRLAIRPRGFVSLRAPYSGGQVVTRPFIFSGEELRLNYSTSAAGSLRVEVQDEAGAPLPGFGLDEMKPLFGDRLDGPAAWQGAPSLAPLAGRPVRLRFAMRDADVFGFRFR